MHSYGKTGYGLKTLGQGLVPSIASNRSLPLPSGLPTLPYAVTEHQTHTTGVFSTISSTLDTPYEASRIGTQARQD